MASQGFLAEQGGLLKILYLGTRNSLEGLEASAFTKAYTGGQLTNNPTVNLVKKVGCLAGSVAAIHGNGVLGAGNASDDAVVGLFVNDVAGNAYESTSAAASGKGVYVMNMGSYEVGIFETHEVANPAVDIWGSYQPGVFLYCSANGLLTTAAGLVNAAPAAGATIMGIITKAPTPSDPIMRFNLRV